MDLEALEYTRQHYNKHSNQFQSTREALAARKQGPGAPLKTFHNRIKRELINRFASSAPRLLDLACGRGGDIWKWIDAGIKTVKGVDLSPGEIEEARKRFQEARDKRGSEGKALAYEFVDSPALGLQEWREPEPYDVVTCMFAIHYFFVTEASLKRFLENVAINLKDGGYFIGTVPDGKRVNECVRKGHVYDSEMLRIEAKWQGAPACFGSPYICAIGDTVTGSEKGTEGSLEYLVYGNVLAGVAAQYGLKPVLRYDAPSLDPLLDPADEGKPLKHFWPQFPNSHPSLEAASRLFTTFVFQKTSGEAAPPPPPGQQQQQPAVAQRKRSLEEAGGLGAGQPAAAAAEPGPAGGATVGTAAGEAHGEPPAKKDPQYKRPTIRRPGARPAAEPAAGGGAG